MEKTVIDFKNSDAYLLLNRLEEEYIKPLELRIQKGKSIFDKLTDKQRLTLKQLEGDLEFYKLLHKHNLEHMMLHAITIGGLASFMDNEYKLLFPNGEVPKSRDPINQLMVDNKVKDSMDVLKGYIDMYKQKKKWSHVFEASAKLGLQALKITIK